MYAGIYVPPHIKTAFSEYMNKLLVEHRAADLSSWRQILLQVSGRLVSLVLFRIIVCVRSRAPPLRSLLCCDATDDFIFL